MDLVAAILEVGVLVAVISEIMDAAARRQLGHHSLVVMRGGCGRLGAFWGSAIYNRFTAVCPTEAAFHILIELFGQGFIQVW